MTPEAFHFFWPNGRMALLPQTNSIAIQNTMDIEPEVGPVFISVRILLTIYKGYPVYDHVDMKIRCHMDTVQDLIRTGIVLCAGPCDLFHSGDRPYLLAAERNDDVADSFPKCLFEFLSRVFHFCRSSLGRL